MKTKHLDRSRPYGEVHPAGTDGIHFEQDGYPFDHEGRLVTKKLTDEQKIALAKPPETKKQPAPVLTAEQTEALKKAGLLTPEQEQALAKPVKPPKPGIEAEGKADEGEEDTSINLELWLKGEVEYDFRDVQNAVKVRYHIWKTKREDLVQFLVEDASGPHVVPAKQVGATLRQYLDKAAA